MSTINALVTAGKTWTPDAQNRIKIEQEDLAALATPTVQVPLDASVDTEDLVDEAVTPAKLSEALADLIPYASIAVAAEASDNVDVTITIKDANGAGLAAVHDIGVWLTLSTTTLDPDVTTFPDGGVSVQSADPTDGVEITAAADDVCGRYLTKATGVLVLRFNHTAGALSGLYCVVSIGGRTTVSSALSWAA